MPSYLTHAVLEDGALVWTLISSSYNPQGRVSIASYVMYPPSMTHSGKMSGWELYIFRQFTEHRVVQFETKEKMQAFVANRIYEGSGRMFKLSLEEINRGWA